MSLYIYKLNFQSGFHIDSLGNDSYGQSDFFIHSDTLSSALLSIWAERYPNKINGIIENPPYLLSSAFPYLDDILFLPCPKHKSLICENLKNIDNSSHVSLAKKLKKASFIPENLFKKMLSDPDFYLIKNQEDFNKIVQVKHNESINQKNHKATTKNNQYILKDSFLIPKEAITKKLFEIEESQRVSIDRETNQSIEGQLFLFNQVCYQENSGLYFIVQFPDSSFQNEFEEILSLLGDTGIGSDRNSGKGLFEYKKIDSNIGLSYNSSSTRYLNLSLFCPSESEQQNISSWFKDPYYEIKKRSGWITNSSLRRKKVFMFSEGSVFNKTAKLKGSFINLSPEKSPHPVWRDGRSLFIEF